MITPNERLRQLCKERKITHQQLSNVIFITRPNVTLLLHGGRSLRDHEIIAICEYFNVSADWLLGLKGEDDEEASKTHQEVV